MTSFVLSKEIDIGQAVIGPTSQVQLADAQQGFVAQLKRIGTTDTGKEIHGHDHLHHYGQAIAALFAFVTDSPVNAPRDSYTTSMEALATQLPVLVAGPGSTQSQISAQRQELFAGRLKDLLGLLHSINDDERFTKVVQAIRLAQLAQLNRKTDFELGFALLIASIEACSQLAIDRDDPELQDDKIAYSDIELSIKAFCESEGPQYKGWFKQRVRDQAKLQRRFVEYILRYCPPEEWPAETEHPQQRLRELVQELSRQSNGGQWEWITKMSWDDVHPASLSADEIEKVLQDTYSHRSSYLHAGDAMPHRDDRLNRFFEKATPVGYHEKDTRDMVLARFDLMAGVARSALSKWLSSSK